MAGFIEVQAFIDGREAPTKKALKEAVKAAPETVEFADVGGLNRPFFGGLADIPAGVTLTVVGPDPWWDRRWFASVREGKVSTDRDEAYFDLFITAIEGGVNYWAEVLEYRWTWTVSESADYLGFYAVIRDMEDGETHRVRAGTIQRGVSRLWDRATDERGLPAYHTMAAIALKRGRWDTVDFDAETADMVVQLGLFGEVVYG